MKMVGRCPLLRRSARHLPMTVAGVDNHGASIIGRSTPYEDAGGRPMPNPVAAGGSSRPAWVWVCEYGAGGGAQLPQDGMR
jgi:hypothetical protein